MLAVSQAEIEARGLSDLRAIAEETPGVSLVTNEPRTIGIDVQYRY